MKKNILFGSFLAAALSVGLAAPCANTPVATRAKTAPRRNRIFVMVIAIRNSVSGTGGPKADHKRPRAPADFPALVTKTSTALPAAHPAGAIEHDFSKK